MYTYFVYSESSKLSRAKKNKKKQKQKQKQKKESNILTAHVQEGERDRKRASQPKITNRGNTSKVKETKTTNLL